MQRHVRKRHHPKYGQQEHINVDRTHYTEGIRPKLGSDCKKDKKRRKCKRVEGEEQKKWSRGSFTARCLRRSRAERISPAERWDCLRSDQGSRSSGSSLIRTRGSFRNRSSQAVGTDWWWTKHKAKSNQTRKVGQKGESYSLRQPSLKSVQWRAIYMQNIYIF